MLIAFLYCMGSIPDALATPTGYPFIEILTQGSRSIAGGTAYVHFHHPRKNPYPTIPPSLPIPQSYQPHKPLRPPSLHVQRLHPLQSQHRLPPTLGLCTRRRRPKRILHSARASPHARPCNEYLRDSMHNMPALSDKHRQHEYLQCHCVAYRCWFLWLVSYSFFVVFVY
jgi:hypothetical protein